MWAGVSYGPSLWYATRSYYSFALLHTQLLAKGTSLRGLPGCGKEQPRLFGIRQPRSIALVLLKRCPLRIFVLLAGLRCGWCRIRLCTPIGNNQS